MTNQREKSLHTTPKTLINTVTKVRELVNALLYKPATTPITDIQIYWLLHSPLESIIKNILFFEMVYGAVLDKLKRNYIYKLLKKVGLKEQAQRYHEWLLKRQEAQSSPSPQPELMLQIAQYRLTPSPVIHSQEQLLQLNLRLTDLHKALSFVKDELSNLFVRQQELVKNLIILNQSHVNTVHSLAKDSRIEIPTDQIITVLPEAHNVYHIARTPLEQIRALGMLINEGAAANNNITYVKQFLSSKALRTAMTAFEDGLGMLEIEFSMVTESVIACQMRHTDLMSEIEEVEAMINSDQINSASPGAAPQRHLESPRPEPKQFLTKDLHEMLASWSPYESASAKTVAESKTPLSKIATRPSLASENKLAIVLDTKISTEDDGIGRWETSEDKLAPKNRNLLIG